MGHVVSNLRCEQYSRCLFITTDVSDACVFTFYRIVYFPFYKDEFN